MQHPLPYVVAAVGSSHMSSFCSRRQVTTPESVRAEVGTNVTDVGKVVTLPGIARCPTPANEAPRAPPWNATDAGRPVISLVTAPISYTRLDY